MTDPAATDDGPPWFFNIRTGRVEGRSGAPAADRLGPYASREDAVSAMERVQQRNEVWDQQDERDDDER